MAEPVFPFSLLNGVNGTFFFRNLNNNITTVLKMMKIKADVNSYC